MKSTKRDRGILLDENAAVDDLVRAVSRIGADHLYQHEGRISCLLNHPEARLRGKAARILVGLWHRKALLHKVVDMLHNDHDSEARSDAATALAIFASSGARAEDRSWTADERQDLLRHLAKAVVCDDDPYVQARSYECLLQCIAPALAQTVPLPFVLERDVDWKLLEPYIDDG